MFRYLLAVAAAALLAIPAVAGVEPFPPSFHSQAVQTNGTSLHVRVGGQGPAVLLLHGFGDTGDMWAPLAAVLVKDHTVIVPDLRGMGSSAPADGGYTKKNQALDIAGVMDALNVSKADLVTHDIGNMVGYALAAQYPARIARWVPIDAPIPGIGDWDAIIRSPLLWHFNFRGPDMERLVQGRERIYLDRFWNELSADPKAIDEETRQHYANIYAQPHRMHNAFEQFAAFNQDAIDNQALLAKGGKLTMPVYAIGAEKSFGKAQADVLRYAASNVTGVIVPNSGHWIMEENPRATIKLVTEFLAAPVGLPQTRVTPDDVEALEVHDSGEGTSGVGGIRTTVVAGDPTKPGMYTIRLSIPPNTRIQAHTHRDDRTAVVVSGVWYFGYGDVAGSAAEKSLPAGSFYTEPGGVAHFAETKEAPVLVYITGNGPSDTVYVKASDEPRAK
jgi:pimeloyl-ACP methyl ester carboxylesterase/quercetin dioxygenase-like cupin family protein